MAVALVVQHVTLAIDHLMKGGHMTALFVFDDDHDAVFAGIARITAFSSGC
jgi:hypothetical protein